MSGAPDPWGDFRYQGQTKFAGQQGTDLQRAYATGYAPYVDPNQPVGSAANPSYDTPDAHGSGIWHVTENGQMVNDQGQVQNPLGREWAEFVGEPRMTSGEDAARTVPGALARGLNSVVGMMGDAGNLGQQGFNWLADHALATAQDVSGNDFGVAHHPHTEAKPRDILNGGDLTSGDLNAAVQQAFGAYHQPQTIAGRAVDTVGQMAPAALLPGGVGVRIARVLVPGAASDVAGELTRGTPYEGPARLAGALVGGGLQGFGENIVNGPQVATSRFLKGYTPEQLADAIDFQRQTSAVHGIDLTPLEALTQRSGGAANQLQHYVENSASGKPLTAPFFDQRRGQVKSATDWLADLISPQTGQTPGMLGIKAQGEANGALAGVRRGINADAQSYYDALKGQTMPPEAFAQLQANPSFAKALADFRGQTEISAPYAHLPDDNLAVVNEVQKQIDANANAAAPGEFNPQGNHQLEAARTAASTLTGQVARDASAPYGGQYGVARDTVAQGIADQLDPLRAGPLGVISTTPDVSAQTSALYPAQPNVGGVPELVEALQRLPGTGAPLTRQHVLDTADQALADLQGGENQWAGAKLAKALAGTDERGARLAAGVQTASGPLAADHLATLLDGLQATGKRLPTGSGTQFNAERAAAMGVSPLPVRFLGGALDPLEWGQHLNKAVGGALYKRNIGDISGLLTDMSPEEAHAFLAKSLPQGEGAANRLALLLLNGSNSETRH